MAPSTYYAAKSRGPSQRAQRDAVLGPTLVQLWKDNYCVYGARTSCGKRHAGPVTTWAAIRLPG